MDKQEFIKTIAGFVCKYAKQYGILVHSPIIAQAILESGWGKSTLSSKYHNYFGLKCGTKWTGKSVNMTTQEEYQEGVHTTIKDNFRVYDSMEEGIKGYFEFIQLPRYSNLKGITDPLIYLETIKGDGYATSSTYVESNMQLVRQFNLTQYDKKEVNGMDRTAIVKQAQSWIGYNEGNGTHKRIIDVYNAHRPLARGYVVKYTDAWCATFVSACAIKTGCTAIIPTECSCEQMIRLFAQLGEWVENDAYVPSAGDVIFYDWDDNGSGDCTGFSDHVGIVEYVSGDMITVIEGNISNSVGRRKIKVNAKCIRGYGVPRYTTASKPSQPAPQKDLTVIAQEVIAGLWGNGSQRKSALELAGYNFNAVQAKVNEILSGKKPSAPSKTIEQIAQEVLAGQWGNGQDRINRLTSAGYDANAVQNKVNQMVNSKSIDTVAREVIQGKWGNGAERKRRLTQAGYDFNAVQNRANALL